MFIPKKVKSLLAAGAATFIKFYAPEGYALHTDHDTGVPGRFRKKPVVMKWTFNYTPRKW